MSVPQSPMRKNSLKADDTVRSCPREDASSRAMMREKADGDCLSQPPNSQNRPLTIAAEISNQTVGWTNILAYLVLMGVAFLPFLASPVFGKRQN